MLILIIGRERIEMKTKFKLKESQILWVTVIVHTVLLYLIIDFDRAMETYRDELIYYNIAKCIANGQPFTMHGNIFNFTKVLYSLVLSPLFLIKNTVLRMHLIGLLNSTLMSLSIVPVWLMCNELGVNKKYRWIAIFIIAISPDMLMAATFMSENLYWPLTLFTFYFVIRLIKYNDTIDVIILSVLSLLCYFCKEVGICVSLAVIALFILSPLESYFVDKNNIKTDNLVQYFKKNFQLKNFLIYLLTCFIIYILIDKIVFSKVQNSYSVADVFTNERVTSFSFLFQSLGYYVIAVTISFFIIPVIYPLSIYKNLHCVTRKAFFYFIILFLGTVATIVYTITMREDIGKDIVRIHLRYVSSYIGILFPIFGSSLLSINKKIDKRLWIGLTIFVILSFVFFNGAETGSIPESMSLYYIVYYTRKVLELFGGKIFKIFTVGFIVNLAIALLIFIGYLLRNKLRIVYRLFLLTIVVICFLNYKYLLSIMYAGGYSVLSQPLKEMSSINSYFYDNNLKNDSVMFISQEWYIKNSKIFDTYFETEKNYSISYSSFSDSIENCYEKTIDVAEIKFFDSLLNEYLDVDKIDYFIVDTAAGNIEDLVENLTYMDEVSTGVFSVYKNSNPTKIDKKNYLFEKINFYESEYNANNFEIFGVSHPEQNFSWTDGKEFIFNYDAKQEIENVVVSLDIVGTYNGAQNYIIYSDDTEISSGCIEGAGEINFQLRIADGNGNFKIVLPDAVSPKEIGESEDSRILALAISNICLNASE